LHSPTYTKLLPIFLVVTTIYSNLSNKKTPGVIPLGHQVGSQLFRVVDLGGKALMRSGLTMTASADVITLLKALSLQVPHLLPSCLGGNGKSRSPDRTMAAHRCR
jgi:hypothetical protein